MDEKTGTKSMGQVIQIDETRIRDHLGEMVRGAAEEALNAMLDAEVDRLCGACATSAALRREQARSASKPRSCAARPRDRDHRALPASGELGRGGSDRDVGVGPVALAGVGGF